MRKNVAEHFDKILREVIGEVLHSGVETDKMLHLRAANIRADGTPCMENSMLTWFLVREQNPRFLIKVGAADKVDHV